MRGIPDSFPQGVRPYAALPCKGLFWPHVHAGCNAAQAGAGTGSGKRVAEAVGAQRFYRVRKVGAAGEFATVTQALAQWAADKDLPGHPRSAIIEIGDSATYHEAPQIVLSAGERLALRAASFAQPVLRMFDYGSGAPEQVRIDGAPGSSITLDGLRLAGGPLLIDDAGGSGKIDERFMVTLRHCTLEPGWDSQRGALVPWRGKASITVRARRLGLRIEHCVSGPLHAFHGDGLLALQLSDSIIDAGHPAGVAIGDVGHGHALARATVLRSTVIGLVQIEELSVAEESVFLGPLLVVRRSSGRVLGCHLAPGSRTPAITCQADGAAPDYLSLRFGSPGYCAPADEREDDDATLFMGVGRKSPAGASSTMVAST